MKHSFLIPYTTLGIFLTLAIPLGSMAQESRIIARVADEDVTSATIAPFFADLSEADRQALADNPALLNQTVRNAILRRLLVKEALASGWDKKPEVAERLGKVQEAVILEAYLKKVTEPPTGFPSDKEISEVYEERKSELKVPRQLLLSQIYIPQAADPDKIQDAAAKVLLDQVQAKLKAPGADFADVATEFSQEKQTAAKGGEIGWVALDSLQPEVRTAVAKLAKGNVSAPIVLPDGFYIVKVNDIREERTPMLDEVKPQIAEALRTQRSQQNMEAYLAKVRQQYPMSINELSLPELIKN
ncbi:MAG: peptidylprolyl isomerase [Terrimicrobiaceae bacterium]